jgi:serine/threonine protein kinase
MAREICEGLNAAHEASVIHRDIKTRNILIGPNNECKITDFGLAASDRAVHMSVVGTLLYMAPEQKSGLPTDKRADVFSMGAVLYRMVTGLDPLFVLNNQPPDDPKEIVPNLPDFLVNTIYRCAEQDRNKRFQNCEELIAALDGVDPGAPASGSTDSGLGITELIGEVESISDELGTGFWAPIIDDELLESRWMNLANGLKERGISAPDDVHFDLMIEDRVGDVQAIMVWSSPHGSLFLIEEGVEIVGEPGGHIVHASPESDPSEVSQKIQQWLENGGIL